MYHFDKTKVRLTETFLPPHLQSFSLGLEATQTTQHVWALLTALGQNLGLPIVEYAYATDLKDWEKASFVRTTMPSAWIEEFKATPHMRHTSYFRAHACHYLNPILMGQSYFAQMGPVSDDKRHHIERAAVYGLSAGIGIPLRMGEAGQAAMLCFGGDYSKEAFDALIAKHGWTLHSAALMAHARYTELFKSEFILRNELSDKQLALLKLVGNGLMDKQIAYELGISFSAVRQRLSSVQQKTGAQTRADLVAIAVRTGLVPDPILKPYEDEALIVLSTADGESPMSMRHPTPQVATAAE